MSAMTYDNPNISNSINNLAASLQGNLEDFAVEIRNATEMTTISTSAGMVNGEVDNLRFQVVTLEGEVATQSIRINELEQQMSFLIKMFKKMEEIDVHGNVTINIPAEAKAEYSLKNELKFK